MAQVTNIDKYLVSDTIFEKINKKFIRMDSKDTKFHNEQILEPFLNGTLIDGMKKQSPLFAKTFQRIAYSGSYYKGTRVGQPEEYDLNIVINLPFKEEDLQFFTDQPGYIKIRTPWKDIKSKNVLKLDPKASKELNSFIDEQSYLSQEKFRTWMEGILSKVFYANSENGRIILPGYTEQSQERKDDREGRRRRRRKRRNRRKRSNEEKAAVEGKGREDIKKIRITKSGPAFTIHLRESQLNSEKETHMDIDLVPVLVFSNCWPPKCSKMNFLKSHRERCWSVVPKPLTNRGNFGNEQHRYWRLCFYEFEKDMLSDYNYGRMKPVIRQLKKLRDTQNWKSIASYYLETLCYHEKEMFHISNKKSHTYLFYKMLEKLRDAFHNHCIPYYWDDDLNLLNKIKPEEIKNMEGRLENVLKNITKTIVYDQYAIAKWVLDKEELECLKIFEHATTSEPELEPEPELESNQGHCVIF